jgi:uncharacterized protein with PIN domain
VDAAELRFYAELNDHLPADFQYKTLRKSFHVPGSVKDMIESFGVPHTEIELIIANGTSVDFSYVVRDGDRIAVYPMFESLDVTPQLRVRPTVLRDPRFILDVHLGRLAAYLRMLGFDALYQNPFEDSELVRISSEQQRILLTRDRGLLKHRTLSHGYWLRETASRRQLAEVIRRFDLARQMRPFTRCMACNGPLREVHTNAVAGRVPPLVLQTRHQFSECPVCNRIYWRGTHHSRMQRWIQQLVGA